MQSETEKLSRIGSYKINLDTGKVEWTVGLYQIFGMSLSDNLPTTEKYYDFIHPDDKAKVIHMFNDSATKSIPFDLKYRIVIKDGTLKNVHSKSVVISDESGHKILFGFLRDITEEIMLMKEVQDINERFLLYFNSLQEGVAINRAIYDENGFVVDYEVLITNRAFNKQSSYIAEDIVGKRATEAYNMSSEYIKQWWEQNKNSQFPVSTEYYDKQGDSWTNISTSNIEKGIFATAFFDITEKKKKDLLIKESEKKYKQLVENAPFGIVLFSEKETFFANNYLAQLLKIKSADTICKKNFLTYIHPKDKERFKQILKTSIKQKTYNGSNYRICLANDRKEILVEILVTIIHTSSQTQWQCIINDISKEIKVKNQAKRLLTDALFISRKLSLFSDIKREFDKVIEENGIPVFPFQNLLTQIKAEINLEKLWSAFQDNFEVVYEDFFNKLINQAPSLTQQEIKHCAFIKMNFETKEIATLFNIKPTSVQIGRVRIKKKLKLDSDQELFHFILTL